MDTLKHKNLVCRMTTLRDEVKRVLKHIFKEDLEVAIDDGGDFVELSVCECRCGCYSTEPGKYWTFVIVSVRPVDYGAPDCELVEIEEVKGEDEVVLELVKLVAEEKAERLFDRNAWRQYASEVGGLE